jgi:hypothetical protein
MKKQGKVETRQIMSDRQQAFYDDLTNFPPTPKDRQDARKLLLNPRDSLLKFLEIVDHSK